VSLSSETIVTVSHRGDFSRIAGPFFSTAKEDLSVYRSIEPTVLVICLASLTLNWGREIHKVSPADAVEVIGVRDKTVDALRWVVINYDQLARHAVRLDDIDWSGVIVDEGHFIKNASQRTSQVLKIVSTPSARTESETGLAQVYLLTGTTMPNRPGDLFNLLRAVGHPDSRCFLSSPARLEAPSVTQPMSTAASADISVISAKRPRWMRAPRVERT
jgi:SNF2 family DNA or RNA helicase